VIGGRHCHERPPGIMIVARSHTICIIVEPEVVQAIAALNAMELSRDLGLPSIMLKCDSLQVVNAVKVISQNWSIY
jgi:hypothetical protein